jgi:transposase
MKKYRQFLVSKSPRGRRRIGITIGIDLGDIWWHYSDLNKNGEVIDRGRFQDQLCQRCQAPSGY